ncbi:MAG: ParB N-terminal domain-containing protein [Variovorax sp.]
MEHTKELLSIDLSNLVPSPYNVRRHSSGQVEELAALIDAQGLLHNLMVTEQVTGRGNARKVRFAVAAGERRRRALLLLQQRGRLPKSHAVLCELVSPERALEVSLAENSGREPMHPADEFEAFKALIDEGKGIEDVAARFGMEVLTVQRRLKLSAVSPKLLALYREGGINLDQLMALTLTDDHALQERAWFDARAWDRTPSALRRVLTAGEVEASGNALVRFVGIDAYEAAGGVVRRDLFDDDRGRYLSDPELLRRLAVAKLEALTIDVRAEGWSWVDARVEFDSHALRQFTPCEHTLRKASAEERFELADLAARAKELEREERTLSDASEWSAVEAECIELEEQAIEERRRAIQSGLKTWAAEENARSGVIVTVTREGDPEIIRGLVREGDRKPLAASRKARTGAESGVTGESSGAPATAHPKADGSEKLLRRLAAHRTAALQVAVSRNTQVALATLTHAFALRVFGSDGVGTRSAMQVTPQLQEHALLAAADDLKGSAAWEALQTAEGAWIERLPEQRGDWLGWLIALDQHVLLELLTFCSALSINALPSAGVAPSANAIANAVALNMADWWEPSAVGYLNHVSKAQIVEALKEAGSGLVDEGVAAMKKDALVVKAAARLAGTHWLPKPLRSSAV